MSVFFFLEFFVEHIIQYPARTTDAADVKAVLGYALFNGSNA
jgi:hypothetical protein